MNRFALSILIVAALVGAFGLLDRGPSSGGPALPVAIANVAGGTSVAAEPSGAPAPVDTSLSTPVPLSRDVVEQLDRASASAPILSAGADVSDVPTAPVLTRDPPDVPTAPPFVVAHVDYYANCAEVRNAGMAPLRKGDNGYRPALDRDSDGFACEYEADNSTPAKPAVPSTVDPYGPDGEDPREDDLSIHDDPTDDEQNERAQEREDDENGTPPALRVPGLDRSPKGAPSPGDPKDLD